MGALVPNPNDMEVIRRLNEVFSDPHLSNLRAWIAANDPDFFASGRKLARIAYRLQVHPTSTAAPNPRGRWFKFLKDFLKERPGGPGTQKNHDIILAALESFVEDINCSGIRFWARYGAADELPQGPPPIDYRAVVTYDQPDTGGAYWASITLLCRHELASNAGTSPDPTQGSGEADPGEGGAEQPSI